MIPDKARKDKTVGILGGMGPEATVDLMQRVILHALLKVRGYQRVRVYTTTRSTLINWTRLRHRSNEFDPYSSKPIRYTGCASVIEPQWLPIGTTSVGTFAMPNTRREMLPRKA